LAVPLFALLRCGASTLPQTGGTREPTAPDAVSPWSGGLTLRTWSGFNDNPQLSSLNEVGSGFVGGGGDLLLFRLAEDGLWVSFFASLDHIGYLAADLDPETVAIASAEIRQTWASGWSLGAMMDYLYFKQVFDASEIQGVPLIVSARAHTWSFKPLVGWAINEEVSLELQVEATREWLGEPLDDLWDVGTKITARWDAEPVGELAVSYGFRQRRFASRPTRDAEGNPLPETLAYSQHEVEATWTKTWGPEERWRTTLRTGLRQNLDNGSGFFDYDRVQVGAGIRYVGTHWELRADARWRWYTYPVQRVGGPESPSRRRSEISVTARGEWKFNEHLRAFAEYTLESSDENVAATDYNVNSISGGLELDL
jgi:hypothetical protein